MRKTNSPDDEDGIKHSLCPPLAFRCSDRFRALFMIGDPFEVVLSLFRRKLQYGQWQKVTSMAGKREGVFVRQQESLDSVLQRGVDPFFLRKQLENWTNPDLIGYPVKVVKYSDLFSEEESIRKFLGVDESFKELGIVKKERLSSLRLLGESEQTLLEEVYGDLRVEVEALPRSHVILPGSACWGNRSLLRKAFWKSGASQIANLYFARD